MSRLRIFVLLLLLLVALPAFAATPTQDVLTQLQARVAQLPVLRGEFEQEKQVQGFKNPLRSSGNFLIARDRGLLWQTRKPFPSELVFTRDRILQRGTDGTIRVEADARQQPGLRQVNALMFALMHGDLRALEGQFQLQPQLLAGNRWQLQLTPKGAALARLFVRITLEGDRHVRSVLIEERGGDRSQLRFSAMSETPATLTADEARRFD
ncbi:MAG: outer membrane lipoprotein carrier protein LolA [Thermomonas sp.]|uniref:outer membrane lipoprotein carrier protein LolA n=1 Tax=Thermomonas sp. TaxID=1971895 RepID=UPI001EC199C1|nr:outer membrane lipoprotein carrier protein LolA [Thermomonas sp.]MBV2209039.1 outer membrane lipoprotein carrier protein LolA [Thermomonas sp.]